MKLIVFSLFATLLSLSAEDSHPTPPATKDIPNGSLYALDSTWTNQHGKKVEWAKGAGKARVVAMGYSTCQGICPRIIADMQRIESKLTEEEHAQVAFTFFSLAPEIDGVPELQQLVKNHKLNQESWELLTGTPDHVLEHAVALGIQFTRLANKVDYAHSYLIAVLSPDGKIIHKWTSPSETPEASLKALRKSLQQ